MFLWFYWLKLTPILIPSLKMHLYIIYQVRVHSIEKVPEHNISLNLFAYKNNFLLPNWILSLLWWRLGFLWHVVLYCSKNHHILSNVIFFFLNLKISDFLFNFFVFALKMTKRVIFRQKKKTQKNIKTWNGVCPDPWVSKKCNKLTRHLLDTYF